MSDLNDVVFGYIEMADLFADTKAPGVFVAVLVAGMGWTADYQISEEKALSLMVEADVNRLSFLQGKPLRIVVNRDAEGVMTTIKSISIAMDPIVPPA